jgi:hypothetical protein
MTFVNGYLNLVGPSSTAIDVTSLTVTPTGTDANIGLEAYTVPSSATSCTTTSGSLVYYLPHLAANVPFSASFPTPLRVAPASGKKACLYAVTGVGGTLWVNVSGFRG